MDSVDKVASKIKQLMGNLFMVPQGTDPYTCTANKKKKKINKNTNRKSVGLSSLFQCFMNARKWTENALIAFFLLPSLRIGLAIKMSSCIGQDGKWRVVWANNK